MNIQHHFLTSNDCYKSGRQITPAGIVVHDTATNQRKVSAYLTSWNKSGVEKCVHAFIGTLPDGSFGVAQTLPWSMRCWGCGSGSKGSYNNTHIQFEICQDDRSDQAWFEQCYTQAVELCADLCRTYGLSVDTIVDHSEAHARGYASNHADTTDWFPLFGKNMDTFRADVQAVLNGGTVSAGKSAVLYRVRKSWDDASSQLGAFSVLDNAKTLADANPGYSVFDSTGTAVYTPGGATPDPDPDPAPESDTGPALFQRWLNAGYSTGLNVDGLWGPKTRTAAIRALQTELNAQFGAGLDVDGLWGPKTRAACVNVRQGAKGNLTRIIQGRLYCMGYDPSGFDGSFGPGCAAAVKTFQTDAGLSADGIVGKNTWAALLG